MADTETLPTRARILRAAAALYREQGFNRASMRDLAERVGIHKSSLYHHFPSKQALLLEILETTVDRSTPVLAAIADSGLPATERLRQAVANHVTELIADRDNVACFIEEGRNLDRAYMEIYIAKRDRYEGLVRQIIDDGVHTGEFAPVSVRLASLAILGMCNWVARWWRPDGEFEPQEIADRFGQMAVQSLKSATDPSLPGSAAVPARLGPGGS